MTIKEIRAFILAACEADGGCIYCISNVMVSLMKQLPDEPWGEAMAEMRPKHKITSYGFDEIFKMVGVKLAQDRP